MKTHNYTHYYLMLLVLVGLFSSCNKGIKEIPDQNSSNQTNAIISKILKFRADLNYKSPVTLTNDSVEWYLEALLNFENANNDHWLSN
jgi:hypothetical protein